VYVAQQLQQMTVLFHKNAPVPSSKQLSVYTSATVISLGIHAVYVPHSPGQIAGRCLNENMVVVGHKAKYGNPQRKHVRCLLQQGNKSFKVFTIRKDFFTMPSTVHHVILSAWVFNSKWSCHILNVLQLTVRVKQRLDP
jgi:hypothetical protein